MSLLLLESENSTESVTPRMGLESQVSTYCQEVKQEVMNQDSSSRGGGDGKFWEEKTG